MMPFATRNPLSRIELIVACLLAALTASTARGQRDLRDIPPPDPELERATFQLAEGFEVNLFAADPQIAKPIQINFDAAGRLWIASSEVYPQILPGQPAADRILVLEDTNGDGTADRTTVFADGLLIPTGVEPGDGGAYVANSTELIHLADTTGDGRADRRTIVLSGFGTEDTHHLLHTLRWGPDGRLYMSQSIYIHSHVETPLGPRRLMGGGVWRFRPEVQHLEVFCRGLVNPWGTHFDRYGQCFLTDGAGGEGINYAFPGAMFPTAVGAARVLHGLNPGSPKHCGLEVVGGSHLPDDWQGNLITCDFRAHRVCRFVVSDDRSGFAAREQPELIRSTHVAFRPVDVKLGPDGAIYLADWYNPIIQHGEVDFRDPRRDKVHGRIWRITAKNRPLAERVDLTASTIAELVEYLGSPEPWKRHFARLQLKQRYHGDQRDAPPRDEPANAIRTALLERYHNLPPLPEHDADRLEVIWTLQALSPNVGRELLAPLLRSADFRIRAAATRVAADSSESADGWFEMLAAHAADPHPRVRLEAINALRQQGTVEAVQAALTALEFPLDTNLDFALWLTARECKHNWLPLVEQQATDLGGPRQLAFALLALDSPEAVVPLVKLLRSGTLPDGREQAVFNAIARHGQGEHLGLVFDLIVADDSVAAARRAALLESLVAASAARRVVPSGDLTRLGALFNAPHPQLAAAAARAAGAWKLEALRQQLASRAADAALPTPLRRAAIEGLASLGGSASIEALAQLASAGEPVAVRHAATVALLPLAPRRAAAAAVALLAGDDGIDVEALLPAFMEHRQGPAALTAALEAATLPPDVAKLAARLAGSSARPDESLIAALRIAGGLGSAPREPGPEEIQQLVAEVVSQADPARGELVYRLAANACQKCHAIAGAGGQVGPDLVSIGASAQVDYLVESILLPNKAVKEGYHSLSVVTVDGLVYSGIRVRETDRDLVLRTAEDRLVTIPRNTIDEQAPGISLMPAGLAENLTRQELVDVVRFLSELGRTESYRVGSRRLARRWQALEPTPETLEHLRRNRLGAASGEHPSFIWSPLYSRVDGTLPLDDLPLLVSQKGAYLHLPQASAVRCELQLTTGGAVRLALNDPAALLLWLDGQPLDAAGTIDLDLPAGRHVLTCIVDRQQRTAPLCIELVDLPGSAARAQWVTGK